MAQRYKLVIPRRNNNNCQDLHKLVLNLILTEKRQNQCARSTRQEGKQVQIQPLQRSFCITHHPKVSIYPRETLKSCAPQNTYKDLHCNVICNNEKFKATNIYKNRNG